MRFHILLCLAPRIVWCVRSISSCYVEDLGGRLGVTLTVVLSAIAFKFVVNDELPNTDTMTVLDQYLFSSLLCGPALAPRLHHPSGGCLISRCSAAGGGGGFLLTARFVGGWRPGTCRYLVLVLVYNVYVPPSTPSCSLAPAALNSHPARTDRLAGRVCAASLHPPVGQSDWSALLRCRYATSLVPEIHTWEGRFFHAGSQVGTFRQLVWLWCSVNALFVFACIRHQLDSFERAMINDE